MNLTLDVLNKTREQLMAERQQLLANVQAIGGALQLLDMQVKQLNEPEPPQEGDKS